MAVAKTQKQSKGQIVVLIIIAVLLAIGYVFLDRYTDGQKDMLTVETRGLYMVQGLTKYRQDTGALPDVLDKLVPKYAMAVSKCPNGKIMTYQPSGADYMLACDGVVFKAKTYSYDSHTKSWNG